MLAIDYFELIRRLGFLLEGMCLVFVAKFMRDLFYIARGYKLRELFHEQTTPAAAIDLCGYILALIFATVHSIIITQASWIGQASDIALTGLMITLMLLLADWITDKMIFRKMDDHYEIYVRHNTALAVGRFGNMIATGLIISGSLGDAAVRHSFLHNLPHCLLWFAFGQVALIFVSLFYQWITSYDDLSQIKENNVAAAVPMASIQIAIGLTINSGIHGVSNHVFADLLAVSAYVVVATFLLYFLRLLFDRLLLPKINLSREIEQEKNLGAGFIEGTSFLVGGIILSYFLT